jgi:hypothetical protein
MKRGKKGESSDDAYSAELNISSESEEEKT